MTTSMLSIDVQDLAHYTPNVHKDHWKMIEKIGEESVTLLKNNRTAKGPGLPLKSKDNIQSIAVLVQDAGSRPFG